MENLFICPFCGAKDKKYIGYLNGIPYCRRCVSFRGEEAKFKTIYPKYVTPDLSYELSEDQKNLSEALCENYKNGINTLVYAVCGSGKTEISLKVISYAMQCGERVGFAIPRRDVVIELYDRFKTIFPKNKIALVYGGHTSDLEGDLICLTTHQLYRYHEYFDLLIIDEIDAFPFKGNDVLDSFFKKSMRGHFIMMSATPSDSVIEEFNKTGMGTVELFSRFHKHPLPVPSIIIRKSFILYLSLLEELERFLKEEKQVFIFTPTIEMCENTYNFLKIFLKNGSYVHSKKISRPETIKLFKEGKIRYLVTTAVLERGVTIKNLQVIVFHAEHIVYDNYALVQIAGRVGRKVDFPDGEVLYLANRKTNEMILSIEKIKAANKKLEDMLNGKKS